MTKIDDLITYFSLWYPLPDEIPREIRLIIYDFMFNPLEDPW